MPPTPKYESTPPKPNFYGSTLPMPKRQLTPPTSPTPKFYGPTIPTPLTPKFDPRHSRTHATHATHVPKLPTPTTLFSRLTSGVVKLTSVQISLWSN